MIVRSAGVTATLVRPIVCRAVFIINVVREASRAHTTALRIMWRTSTLLAVALALCARAQPAGPPAPPLAQTVTVHHPTKPNESANSIRKESNEVQAVATGSVVTGPSANGPLAIGPPATAAPPLEPPVNLRYPSAVLFGRTCGGTIISPYWVLSAGHCTLFTRGRDVLAGTDNSENGSGVRRRVKKLHIHPRFSVGPYWLDAEKYDIRQVAARFDFLLVELETPLPLDNFTIAAATLPPATELLLPPGLPAGYAGYGAEHHGETMRHHMHGMDLMTVDDATCACKLEQYDPHDMLCTTGRPPRNDSACNGDSGSGLVSGNRLLGVASWVEDDASRCFRGAHVIFSRVARVRDWIHKVAGI